MIRIHNRSEYLSQSVSPIDHEANEDIIFSPIDHEANTLSLNPTWPYHGISSIIGMYTAMQ